MDWYLASVSKLTPDQAAKLEAYNKEQDAKHQQDLKLILENAATKESVNNEGQKVIEYTMKNTLGVFSKYGW
jgi:cysteine synthase